MAFDITPLNNIENVRLHTDIHVNLAEDQMYQIQIELLLVS